MDIKVTGCEDCIFREFSYDEWAIGSDCMNFCTLARYKNMPDNIINMYRGSGTDDDDRIDTPEWCPLMLEDINIKKSTN